MKRMILLIMAITSVLSLSGCARKGEVVQEEVGTFLNEFQEPVEEFETEEILETDEPSEPKKPVVKLERLDEATIPQEKKAIFDLCAKSEDLIYYTTDAAKKLEYRPISQMANKGPSSRKYSDYFATDKKRLAVIGTADNIRASSDESTYVPISLNEVFAGEIEKKEFLISRAFYMKSDENGDYFTGLTTDITLDALLLPEEQRLYILEESKSEVDLYWCCITPIVLPEDYRDFDEEYVSELLDYYRGKQYKKEENKGPTKTESGALIYHFSWNPYEKYENYTDEQMLELLEDHLLVQLALRYKIKILPQDNPFLATFEPD